MWVRGPNGAGKTTLLEALYLMDRGRTFRGRRGGPLTTRGERGTAIAGKVVLDRDRWQSLSWMSSGHGARPGGPQLTRFVGVSSFSIVEGDPELRRQFFDWSLFHVEHDVRELWAKLGRLQRQRNAWLRSGARGVPVWDEPYANHLEELWSRRSRFLDRLDTTFRTLTAELVPTGPLGLRWDWTGRGESLTALLRAQLPSDSMRGFTFLSPSRGDVSFLRNGAPWRGSRGENKLAGIVLQMAAQEVMVSATGNRPVVLLDDPYSEVSSRLIPPLLEAWSRAADQVVITSLDDVASLDFAGSPAATFHVEQGALRLD